MQHFAFVFFWASLTCAVGGALVWALLKLAARLWPALALQRSAWIVAQAVIGASFLLALLPHPQGWSVLPGIEHALPAARVSLAAIAPARLSAMSSPAESGDDLAHSGTAAQLAQVWLALYCSGLLMSVTRLLLARRSLRGLLASARPLGRAGLEAHAGFGADAIAELARRGLTVLETEAAVSPMLVGLGQPRLLLPRHLRSLSALQQQLIVTHELTHVRRRDPLLLHLSICLQTLLWFNPALRALGRRLNWAQELSCDQQVLAGRSAQQRQQYAAALVSQLKVQQAVFGAGLAFGNGGLSSIGARVRLIRQSVAAPAGVLANAAVMTPLAALLAASLLLQPAFAGRTEPPAPRTADAALAALAASPSWQAPLEQVRVSSFFGARRGTASDGHHGIDFAARSGTPVLATADGVVLDSTDRFEGGAKYGKVVVVEHANKLRSLYAHLDRRSVRVGDTVKAGAPIGLSGATGKVTGPHLHLEAFDGAQRIDPARLIAGLDAHASESALRARAETARR
jgi:murein DD-endopeptidase MepM/ murein hydrolase activator NlpD